MWSCMYMCMCIVIYYPGVCMCVSVCIGGPELFPSDLLSRPQALNNSSRSEQMVFFEELRAHLHIHRNRFRSFRNDKMYDTYGSHLECFSIFMPMLVNGIFLQRENAALLSKNH